MVKLPILTLVVVQSPQTTFNSTLRVTPHDLRTGAID